MKSILILTQFLMFLILPVNLVYGQQICSSTSAAIIGEVKDINGTVIIGATVSLEPLGETRQRVSKKALLTKVFTNEQGEYFLKVPPGLYKLRVEKDGFINKEVVYGLTLGIPSRVNFSLADSNSGLLSQTVPGTLTGVITRNSNPVIGIRVIAVNLMDNTVAETFTNLDGFYDFSELSPGDYFIKVDTEVGKPDFATQEVFVNSDYTEVLNFTIQDNN